jgi:hypothetical protein
MESIWRKRFYEREFEILPESWRREFLCVGTVNGDVFGTKN